MKQIIDAACIDTVVNEGRSDQVHAFIFTLSLHVCLFFLFYGMQLFSPPSEPETRTQRDTTLALVVGNETLLPIASEPASEERHRNDASTALDPQSPLASPSATSAPSDLPSPVATPILAPEITDGLGATMEEPPAQSPLVSDEAVGTTPTESLSPLQLERLQQLRDLSARGAAVPQDHDLVEGYTNALQDALLQMLDPQALSFGAYCRIRLHQERGGRLAQIELLPNCNLDTTTKARIERLADGRNSLPYAGFETVFSESVELELRNLETH